MADDEQTLLLEEAGLRVGEHTLTAPGGDYPLADVLSVERSVSKPLWVPLLLALLGTINLAFALQTGHADMFVAAGLMLGAGLWYWLRGTRYVLCLLTGEGEQEVWFTRDEQAYERAFAVVQARVQTLRGSGD